MKNAIILQKKNLSRTIFTSSVINNREILEGVFCLILHESDHITNF